MRRRALKQGHWGLVALCLALALSPLKAREKVRSALLEVHGRVHRLLGGDEAPPDSEAAAADNRVVLLEAEVQGLQRALKDARATHELIQQDPNVSLIPAEVLPLAGSADVVQRVALSRGRMDGVREGLPVLADGVLIGRVERVTASTCEVRLVTDPGFRVRATIQRKGRAVEGMLSGTGDATLVFEPTQIDETVAAQEPMRGDRVLCSRASVLCGVPAVLGEVVATRRRPGALLREARVQPGCDLTRLRRVVIVRVGEKERS